MKRTDTDYSRLIGNAQVVMLGETHHETSDYQDEVANSLQRFKQLGYTHFAMEMLQTDQDLTNSKVVINDLVDTFTLGHAKVYKQAKSLGLKIIGLDMPISKQIKLGSQRNTNLYKNRNHWMVDSILKTLKLGHKAVIFVHHGHALGSTGSMRVPDEHGMRSLLKRNNISIVYIQVAGGAWDRGTCEKRGSEVANLAQKDAAQNSRFVSTGGLGIDYVLHLPQNCMVK